MAIGMLPLFSQLAELTLTVIEPECWSLLAEAAHGLQCLREVYWNGPGPVGQEGAIGLIRNASFSQLCHALAGSAHTLRYIYLNGPTWRIRNGDEIKLPALREIGLGRGALELLGPLTAAARKLRWVHLGVHGDALTDGSDCQKRLKASVGALAPTLRGLSLELLPGIAAEQLVPALGGDLVADCAALHYFGVYTDGFNVADIFKRLPRSVAVFELRVDALDTAGLAGVVSWILSKPSCVLITSVEVFEIQHFASIVDVSRAFASVLTRAGPQSGH